MPQGRVKSGNLLSTMVLIPKYTYDSLLTHNDRSVRDIINTINIREMNNISDRSKCDVVEKSKDQRESDDVRERTAVSDDVKEVFDGRLKKEVQLPTSLHKLETKSFVSPIDTMDTKNDLILAANVSNLPQQKEYGVEKATVGRSHNVDHNTEIESEASKIVKELEKGMKKSSFPVTPTSSIGLSPFAVRRKSNITPLKWQELSTEFADLPQDDSVRRRLEFGGRPALKRSPVVKKEEKDDFEFKYRKW